MLERIVIDNFGGIKHLDFTCDRINILIGPQASGKSICVKLIFFFKNFFPETHKSIIQNENKREFDNRLKDRFVNYFPREAWSKKGFKIDYYLNDSWISVSKNTTKPLVIDYSLDIKNLIKKGKKFHLDEIRKVEPSSKVTSFKINRASRDKYYELLKNEFANHIAFEHYFVPAGRSFFANIQSSIFSFLSENQSIDPFLIEFGSFYERFKGLDAESNKSFDRLATQVMNGEYVKEREKDYLIHNDSRKVNISNASSGQQETLPLIVILKTLIDFQYTRGATLYIEEPEAHLFPTAQKSIVQLLARTFNAFDDKFQIFVTTHSPYILSSFNILIEAGKIIEEKPEIADNVYEVVSKTEVIKPGQLVAYSLNRGLLKNIMDEDTQLISQNILDSVSDEISTEFGKLIDLHY